MNIGIIHGFVGGGGGTEKTLHAILEALEGTNHNVTLYTFSKPQILSKKIKIKSSLPISIPYFGLYQRAIESNLISKAKNEDLLIQSSGGLGIPSNPKQKIIVYAHADFSSDLDNPSSKYKGIWLLYYKIYYTMIKKFIEHINDPRIDIISNSKYIQQQIKSKFNKDSIVIYPPVNLDEFNPQIKEKRVVTIGRYSQEKNHNFGINVMKNLNYEYNIIGNTKTKSNIVYYDQLSNLLRNESISNINLHKNIERKKLVNILNHSKIYFHSSNETFGISIIESIAAGCIPIVPNMGGHLETVPFTELRYEQNNLKQAQEKIIAGISGKYDYILKELETLNNTFHQKNFSEKLIKHIEKY